MSNALKITAAELDAILDTPIKVSAQHEKIALEYDDEPDSLITAAETGAATRTQMAALARYTRWLSRHADELADRLECPEAWVGIPR